MHPQKNQHHKGILCSVSKHKNKHNFVDTEQSNDYCLTDVIIRKKYLTENQKYRLAQTVNDFGNLVMETYPGGFP